MESHPDQEQFGEASLGQAQASNPPPDPEMLRDTPEGAETPEEFARAIETDPSRNPPDDELEDLRGG